MAADGGGEPVRYAGHPIHESVPGKPAAELVATAGRALRQVIRMFTVGQVDGDLAETVVLSRVDAGMGSGCKRTQRASLVGHAESPPSLEPTRTLGGRTGCRRE
jgi:hypothetical protein